MNTIALIIPQDFANPGAAGILLILILIPLVVVLFQWLWNITMPQVFNLNTVTFGRHSACCSSRPFCSSPGEEVHEVLASQALN